MLVRMSPMLTLRLVALTVLHVTLLLDTSSSAKILMASSQLKSHIIDQLALGQELVSRGHDVYYVTASR